MSKADSVIDTATAVATAEPRAVGDALRAVVAGSGAARVMASSVALFEAGGRHILDEGARQMIRDAAERGAEGALALAAGPLIGPATLLAKKPIAALGTAGRAMKNAAPLAAKAASRQLLRGAGRAAGVGFVIDGAVASVEAAFAVRNGTMETKDAATYVAKEAATGAVATGAGVLLGAGLIALTGGTAAPVVFAVGALGSIGTKRLLRRFVNPPKEVAVREV